MSAPHPEGAGVHLAMSDALARAGLAPHDIDYINLHGTATPANDRAEDAAIHRIFGDATPCSSTKGWTGHTLGAAGITEAIISALCLEHGCVPGSLNTRKLDPSLRSHIVLAGGASARCGACCPTPSASAATTAASCSGRRDDRGSTSDGVGVIGPGMPDWRTRRAPCCAASASTSRDRRRSPTRRVLPANERRRAAASVRWALAAAQQAVSASGYAAGEVATVFATSGSDGETLHRICEALASPEREVSPTRFHNSVHNAAAGYWTHRGGLAPAVGEPVRLRRFVCGGARRGGVPGARRNGVPVLLVAYDLPYPHAALRRAPVRASVRRRAAARAGAAARNACLPAHRGSRPNRRRSRPFPAALRAELASNPAGAVPAAARDAWPASEREPVRLGYLDGCQLVVELRDMVLSRDAIAALIPHQGAMCLLEEVLSCDDDGIVCRAVSHRDAAHPLRDDGILPAVCGIEYAAQAMAVHGALMDRARRSGETDGSQARHARGSARRHPQRRAAGRYRGRPDRQRAQAVAENGRLLYEFALHAGGRELVRGRAAVSLAAVRSSDG